MTMTDPDVAAAGPTPASPGGSPVARTERFGAASPGMLQPSVSPRRVTTDDDEAPPGRRWWVWLILVAVLAGVGAGCYFLGRHLAPGPGPEAVGVRQGLVAGAPITTSDLILVHVSTVPKGAVMATATAVGHTALTDVPVGAILTRAEVGATAQAFPQGHQVLVGVSVKPGQEPSSGLTTGEFVIAVEQPPSQNNRPVSPVRLTFPTEVVAVSTGSDGTQSVTLSVPDTEATELGVQAAAGNVALIQVARP